MTEFRDVTPEMLAGAEAYGGAKFSDLMQRIHKAHQTYADTCLGSIICGLRRDVLDPQLNDAIDVAKEIAKLRGTLPTCGLIACKSVLEAAPESAYVQPCDEHADGVYVSNVEHGPERPPLQAVPTLPEEA